MTTHRTLALAFCFATLASAAAAAETDPMPELLRRAAERAAEYKALPELVLEQAIVMKGPGGELEQSATVRRKGGKYRLDGLMKASPGMQANPPAPGAGPRNPDTGATPKEMRFAVIFDGRRTWIMNSANPARQIPNETSMRHRTEGDLWAFLGEGAELVRTENVKGTGYSVVETSDEKGLPLLLWIDEAEFLIRRAQFQDAEGGKWTYEYSDFRPIGQGGPRFPWKTEVSRDGRAVSTVTVRSATASGVGDEAFDPQKVKL